MLLGAILRRALGCLIPLAIIAFGLWLAGNRGSSADELADESRQLRYDYQPVCEGERMTPGDVCYVFGDAERTRNYQEMIDDYAESVSPESLAAVDGTWRIVGYAVVGVGVMVLGLFVMGLVALARARSGRRALARAEGWTYENDDSTLLDRLALPDLRYGRPEAHGVLFGERAGLPFVLFDHVDPKGLRRTTATMQLPAPLPHLVVTAAGGKGTEVRCSVLARTRLDDDVERHVRAQRIEWFAVDGRTLVYHLSTVFSLRRAVILRKLDAGARLAALLAGAPRQ